MYVNGSPCYGKSENEATWTIFVIRVIFDNLTRLNDFAYLLNSYLPQQGLIRCML